MAKWASLPLRFGLGIMFAAHGLQKAAGVFNGSGIEAFARMLSGLGFSPPALWAYAAAYAELIGGLFLLLGVFVRISSAVLALVMITAAVTVHLHKGFFLSSGGFEYIFVILCALAALALLGPGELSATKRF